MNISRKPFTIWTAGSTDQVIQNSNTGLVDAIVTNPTVINQWVKQQKDFQSAVKTVLDNTNLPIFIQLKGPSVSEMQSEVEKMQKISTRIIPKVPAIMEGLKLCKYLTSQGIPKLITTVCSLTQAVAFASFGAEYLCPYVARLQEKNDDPYLLIRQTSAFIKENQLSTTIVPASIRNLHQLEQSVMAGANGVIVFNDLFQQLLEHRVTQESLDGFDQNDWPEIDF